MHDECYSYEMGADNGVSAPMVQLREPMLHYSAIVAYRMAWLKSQ